MSAIASELILLAVLLGFGAAYYFLHRFIRRQSAKARSQLDPSDYVVFDALPSQLPDLQADLSDHRWHLVSSEPTTSKTVRYRFEKGDSLASSLSKVLDFETSMRRTANRKIAPDFPIKIKAHGSLRDHNA